MDKYILGCPNCGNQEYVGLDCDMCGFSDFLSGEDNQYETPEGNIIYCTENEALDKGYIHNCPQCQSHTITWWEMEDHGVCIECWHKKFVDNLN